MLKTIIAYSKISKESHRHPVEKLCLCLFPMILVGFCNKPLPIAINIIIFLILHIIANNPRSIVFKFALTTFSFAILSSITFIFIYNIEYIVVIVLKGISGGLCISYLALTTPLDHIIGLLSKFDSLRDICDIAKGMETYILLINDEASSIYTAMKSRNGFNSFKSQLFNMGKLAGLLFSNTLKRWPLIRDSLNSRCYKGYHYYKSYEFIINYKMCLFTFTYTIFLLILI